MNATCYGIVITLFSSMGQGQSHYTRSSIDTLRRNLNKFHKIDIKRRWTFQCLKNMLTAGYITRKSRYRQEDRGVVSQIPSLYSFTTKGIKILVSRRVTGAAKLLKSMIGYLSRKDKRWPQPADIKQPYPAERYTPTGDDWKKLFGVVGRKIE
jgi:hypothetical protein